VAGAAAHGARSTLAGALLEVELLDRGSGAEARRDKQTRRDDACRDIQDSRTTLCAPWAAIQRIDAPNSCDPMPFRRAAGITARPLKDPTGAVVKASCTAGPNAA
jgi:hypothetical protein